MLTRKLLTRWKGYTTRYREIILGSERILLDKEHPQSVSGAGLHPLIPGIRDEYLIFGGFTVAAFMSAWLQLLGKAVRLEERVLFPSEHI